MNYYNPYGQEDIQEERIISLFADAIVLAGLDFLRFSVDGATQKIYELNRVGGEFDKVYRNMDMMVKRAKKHKSNIDLMWQFIALSNNEHEIEKAREMAKVIDIPFFVRSRYYIKLLEKYMLDVSIGR